MKRCILSIAIGKHRWYQWYR